MTPEPRNESDYSQRQTVAARLNNDLDDLLPPYKFDVSIFADVTHPALTEPINRVGVAFYEKKPWRLLDEARRPRLRSAFLSRENAQNAKAPGRENPSQAPSTLFGFLSIFAATIRFTIEHGSWPTLTTLRSKRLATTGKRGGQAQRAVPTFFSAPKVAGFLETWPELRTPRQNLPAGIKFFSPPRLRISNWPGPARTGRQSFYRSSPAFQTPCP